MEIHNVPFFVKQSFFLNLAAFPILRSSTTFMFLVLNVLFEHTEETSMTNQVSCMQNTCSVCLWDVLSKKNWKQHCLPWKQETNDCAKREKTVLFVVHENLTVTTHATKWTCFPKRKNSVSEKHQLKWSKQQFICFSVLSSPAARILKTRVPWMGHLVTKLSKNLFDLGQICSF